jgi:hypothetical protein
VTDAPTPAPPIAPGPPPDIAPAPAPGLTHPCARCGAAVPLDVGLCDRCNPLGLRDSSSSQVHGLAIGGIVLAVVLLALAGRAALSGIGPFDVSVVGVVPEGTALLISLSVTNTGSSEGATTCQVTDPADRTGSTGAFMLSPQIGPGMTVVFSQRVTELGPLAIPLAVECRAP